MKKNWGAHSIAPISLGAILFVDFALNSTKESPISQIVNTHTSVPRALSHTQKNPMLEKQR